MAGDGANNRKRTINLLPAGEVVRVSLGCKETVGAGITEQFRFETSVDGAAWTTNIADSSFANIQNNPSLQEVSFAPVEARYFRFISLRAIWNSGWTSAAEISVLPAGSAN